MTQEFSNKVAVFIGRFNPFHKGHMDVVQKASREVDELLILVGSSNKSPSPRNMFSVDSRIRIINAALDSVQFRSDFRITIETIDDFDYQDDRWISEVRHIVSENTSSEDEIYLIGHAKDNTSYYLNIFPDWKSISVEDTTGISATQIRDFIGTSDLGSYLENKYLLKDFVVSEEHREQILREFREIRDVTKEYRYCASYSEEWGYGPFLTSDAVVTQSGHILLIRRRNLPGKGLLAFPGGFMNPGETIIDCTIRELKEETKIDLPEKVLRGSIKTSELFDDPHRDPRAHIITHATHFALKPGPLIKVKASDDAKDARWYPISDLYEIQNEFFADHWQILSKLTGV